MRILLITHFFSQHYSTGTDNYTLGVARELTARGHDVHVVCAEDWNTGKTYWNGVTDGVHRDIRVTHIHLNWTKAKDPNIALYDSALVEKWLNDYLKELQPDSVHITSTYSLGVGVLRSVYEANIPMVLSLMDYWFTCPRVNLLRGDGSLCSGVTTAEECHYCLSDLSRPLHLVDKYLPDRVSKFLINQIPEVPVIARRSGFRGAAINMVERKEKLKEAFLLPDRIFSHSRYLKDQYIRAGFPDRIEILPNGHDLDWLRNYQGKTTSKQVRFGYFGRISEEKGIHLLISAFRAANLDNYAQIDIFGDLTQEPDYVGKLRDLTAGSTSISFRGKFKRDQLAGILSNIDVLVVPSLWFENSPLVIYEAFATQTPVITTNLGGMAEAVSHEVNGLLFERGNIEDLSTQLLRCVRTPEILDRLITGIPRVRTVREEVDQLEEAYAGLISSRKISKN